MGDAFLFTCLVFFYVLAAYLLTKSAYLLGKRNKWESQNYLGMNVVHSFGLLIAIHYVCFSLLAISSNYVFSLIDQENLGLGWSVFSLSILAITLMGWADDAFGSTSIKGLKGHLRAFFVENKLTSGFLKAVVGSFVALGSTYFYSSTIFQWLLQASLVIFSIHFFNLLDVRPGRTLKSFWFLILVFIPVYPGSKLILYYLPIILSTILIFPYERNCLTMLGDAGSNVLGFVYGFYLIMLGDTPVQICFLTGFVLLSLAAEKISFSEYIKKTPWLAKLDSWGINKYFLKD